MKSIIELIKNPPPDSLWLHSRYRNGVEPPSSSKFKFGSEELSRYSNSDWDYSKCKVDLGSWNPFIDERNQILYHTLFLIGISLGGGLRDEVLTMIIDLEL